MSKLAYHAVKWRFKIGDASPWRCYLPLDKRSECVDRRFFLNESAHELLYGGGYSIPKLETLLHADVDFRSTNEVEVLIIPGSISDAHVVEYVLLSLSKLEMLLYSWNPNWRLFSEGRSSVSASHRELIPVDRQSPYADSRVEERLSSLKVEGEGTHCTAPNKASSSSQ